jgi:ABC-type branched-subunit amino acid transport system permease subunit
MSFDLLVQLLVNGFIDKSIYTNEPFGLAGIASFSFFVLELSEIWSYLTLVTFFVCLTCFTLKMVINYPFGRIVQGILGRYKFK